MVFVQFHKNFTGPSFCGEWARELQRKITLPDISFDCSFEKIVLSSLLLFSRACYLLDLDDIQWNEVATSTALIPPFFKYVKLLPKYLNFVSFKIRNASNFYFEERAPQKTQIFNIFKGPLFRNGWLY